MILHEYIESEEFKEDMQDYEDSDDEEKPTSRKVEDGAPVCPPILMTNVEEQKGIHEPEIEDGLVIETFNKSDKQSAQPELTFKSVNSSSFASQFSESDSESDCLEMTKSMVKTLKRLNDMYVQLTNVETREAFKGFMAKATVLAKFNDV